jgi:hypothetical protein
VGLALAQGRPALVEPAKVEVDPGKLGAPVDEVGRHGQHLIIGGDGGRQIARGVGLGARVAVALALQALPDDARVVAVGEDQHQEGRAEQRARDPPRRAQIGDGLVPGAVAVAAQLGEPHGQGAQGDRPVEGHE